MSLSEAGNLQIRGGSAAPASARRGKEGRDVTKQCNCFCAGSHPQRKLQALSLGPALLIRSC